MNIKDVRNLVFMLGTFGALALFGTRAMAQQQPQPLKVTKVKDNVYWVQGGVGSNDGFIVGKKGVVLVDTKTTSIPRRSDRRNREGDSEGRVTRSLSRTATATTSTGSPLSLRRLTIIAQENCKKEMEASASSRNPAPQDRLPYEDLRPRPIS